MGAHCAFLSYADFLIPVNRTVWTGFGEFLVALCLFHVNHHDAVRATAHCAASVLHAGRFLAVLAGHRKIRHIISGILSALAAFNIYPAMTVTRLSGGVAWPIVVNVLIFTSHEAVVAVMTFRYVYDQISLIHFIVLRLSDYSVS
jgi:hypothetical protein